MFLKLISLCLNLYLKVEIIRPQPLNAGVCEQFLPELMVKAALKAAVTLAFSTIR